MEVSGVPVMAGDDWVKKNTLSNQWTCDATQIHSVNHSNTCTNRLRVLGLITCGKTP